MLPAKNRCRMEGFAIVSCACLSPIFAGPRSWALLTTPHGHFPPVGHPPCLCAKPTPRSVSNNCCCRGLPKVSSKPETQYIPWCQTGVVTITATSKGWMLERRHHFWPWMTCKGYDSGVERRGDVTWTRKVSAETCSGEEILSGFYSTPIFEERGEMRAYIPVALMQRSRSGAQLP